MRLLCLVLRAAAVFANEVVEVFFAVVVGQFFARFDCAFGVHEDFVALYFYFAIRAAGVVDVPRNILSGGAVDGFSVTELEKIFPANAVRFVVADDIAPVFHDEPTLGDGNVGKNTQARSAFARHNGECGFAGDVGHKRKITAKDSRNLEKSLEPLVFQRFRFVPIYALQGQFNQVQVRRMLEYSHLHSIAHISDLHIGSSPEYTFVTKRICDAILASDIQTVILTGDITNRGSVSEFDEFLSLTSELRSNRHVVLLPGNHDRSYANISAQMMGNEKVNLVHVHGIAILRIDTTIWYNRITFASHGNISPAMFREIDRLLLSLPLGVPVIIALHHHPLPLPAELLIEYISSWFSLPFAENLSYGSRLLEKVKGRSDIVLHGHRHVPSEILFPYAQRPLAIYNAGSSTGLAAFRRFDITADGRIQEPTWVSV